MFAGVRRPRLWCMWAAVLSASRFIILFISDVVSCVSGVLMYRYAGWGGGVDPWGAAVAVWRRDRSKRRAAGFRVFSASVVISMLVACVVKVWMVDEWGGVCGDGWGGYGGVGVTALGAVGGCEGLLEDEGVVGCGGGGFGGSVGGVGLACPEGDFLGGFGGLCGGGGGEGSLGALSVLLLPFSILFLGCRRGVFSLSGSALAAIGSTMAMGMATGISMVTHPWLGVHS